MNTHSIEIPGKLIKNCAILLYSTATYVALGFWVSIAPQSIALSELAGRVDSTSSVSHSSALKDDIPIGADDLDRPPTLLELPGNADHFDLLYAEKHSNAITPFLPSRTTDGKNLTLEMGCSDANDEFKIPSTTEGPLTITAELNYWRFSQATLDKIVEKQDRMGVVDYQKNIEENRRFSENSDHERSL